MNTTYVKIKIHVTLHLMLEVRNKGNVNCITYLRMYTYIGVLRMYYP